MSIQHLINAYIDSQSEQKRHDMLYLHNMILKITPSCQLWFLDGKDSAQKTVSNPNIGYGNYTITYADGKIKEFYKIGMSANTTGISIYIFGIQDKTYLVKTYGQKIGKATVSGYCIKFKSLKYININVLETALRYEFEKQTK